MAVRKRKVSGHGWSRKKKPRTAQEPAAQSTSKTTSRTTAARRSKECGAAVPAVFNTAELLENILVHVEFYSLLRAQRVCTQFRDAIASSIAIKQKLFLVVDQMQDRWVVVGNSYKKLRFMQLTDDTTLPPPAPIIVPGILSPLITPKELYPVRINPILEYRQPYNTSRHTVDSEEPDPLFALMRGCPRYYLRHDLHGYSSGASWRRMYLCNPPCTRLKADVTFEVKRSPEHSTTVQVDIEELSGITFGTLVDRALEAPCMGKNGKKCAGSEEPAAVYVEELERLNGRPVYVRVSLQSGVAGTTIRLRGVVAPSEKQWREVAAAARGGQ